MTATETSLDLLNIMRFMDLFNPFSYSFDDTLAYNVEDMFYLEQVAGHWLQVTILLSGSYFRI